MFVEISSNYMKIRPMTAALAHADRWTGRQTNRYIGGWTDM